MEMSCKVVTWKVRFEVLMAMSMKTAVFSDTAPYSLIVTN
jgi:hypothetical protein